MVKEYKDWLFVKVPEDAKEFMISCAQSDNDLLYKNENGYNYIASFGTTVNQYQIIGKGDQLDSEQWKDIVERYIYSGRSSYYAYKDYSSKKPESEDDIIIDATASGYSLLRSLGMEPGTTLILKKNEV